MKPNRLEQLSDGIFAIVMTILVFDLRLPPLPLDAGNTDLWRALVSMSPVFLLCPGLRHAIQLLAGASFFHLRLRQKHRYDPDQHQRLLFPLRRPGAFLHRTPRTAERLRIADNNFLSQCHYARSLPLYDAELRFLFSDYQKSRGKPR